MSSISASVSFVGNSASLMYTWYLPANVQMDVKHVSLHYILSIYVYFQYCSFYSCNITWCQQTFFSKMAYSSVQERLTSRRDSHCVLTRCVVVCLPQHQSEDPGKRHWCSQVVRWMLPALQCCCWWASLSRTISPYCLWNWGQNNMNREWEKQKNMGHTLTCTGF